MRTEGRSPRGRRPRPRGWARPRAAWAPGPGGGAGPSAPSAPTGPAVRAAQGPGCGLRSGPPTAGASEAVGPGLSSRSSCPGTCRPSAQGPEATAGAVGSGPWFGHRVGEMWEGLPGTGTGMCRGSEGRLSWFRDPFFPRGLGTLGGVSGQEQLCDQLVLPVMGAMGAWSSAGRCSDPGHMRLHVAAA